MDGQNRPNPALVVPHVTPRATIRPNPALIVHWQNSIPVDRNSCTNEEGILIS